MLTMLALVAGAYAAAPVVVAGGDPAAVLARVAAVTKVPVTGLRPVTMSELVEGRSPALLGGGTITPCTAAAPNRAAIEASLDIAKGSILYMEYGSARAVLDAAIRGLGCLQEPVDRALAARAWFLLGVVAHASSDVAGSRAAFRQARLFQPFLPWDPNYPPAAQATFDAVATEMKTTAPIAVTVVPEPPNGALRLDGWPVKVVDGKVTVSPGTHHVQVRSRTLTTVTVDLDASSTLVLPQFASEEELGWAGDGERRPALTAILAGAAADSEDVYVVSGDILWRVRPRRGTWDIVGTGMAALQPVPAEDVADTRGPTITPVSEPHATSSSGATNAPPAFASTPAAPSGPRGLHGVPLGLCVAGGGMLLGGAAVNFLVVEPTWAEAEAANARPGSITRDDALTLSNRYDFARYQAIGLLAGGVLALGTGVGMAYLDSRLALTPRTIGVVGHW